MSAEEPAPQRAQPSPNVRRTFERAVRRTTVFADLVDTYLRRVQFEHTLKQKGQELLFTVEGNWHRFTQLDTGQPLSQYRRLVNRLAACAEEDSRRSVRAFHNLAVVIPTLPPTPPQRSTRHGTARTAEG